MSALTIKLTINRSEGGEEEDESFNSSYASLRLSSPPDDSKDSKMQQLFASSLPALGYNHHEEVDYSVNIESDGKFTRKADWEDIASFTNREEPVTKETLKEWVDVYQQKCYPEYLEEPHRLPVSSWIHDTADLQCTLFKDYDWKPIKLNLAPANVDVKEQWTKPVLLEEFPLDYTTNLEEMLRQQGDKHVISTLTKSKLQGHPLALDMMTSDTVVSTEFRGIEATVFRLGHNQAAGVRDEETGDLTWTDNKSLRALLHEKPLPKKKGAGVTRTAKVVALETVMKARVYYKASFSGTVSTDHREPFGEKRFWNWPLKYLLSYNDMKNAVLVYEDVEIRFFTEVRITIDNRDWIWKKNEEGRWYKGSRTDSNDVLIEETA